jgi:hypothetical protein
VPARSLTTSADYAERFRVDPQDRKLADAPNGQDPQRDNESGPAASTQISSGPRDAPAPGEQPNGHRQGGSAQPGRPKPALRLGGDDASRPDTARRPGPAGGADRDQLPAELRDLVTRTLAACRAAEGRNALGGYGTSGLTPAIQRIAAQLPPGGLAPGSVANTVKPADRFAAKLARLAARQPGRPPAEVAAGIGDAIRYAFAFSAAEYTEATWLAHRKLKAQGFELEVRRNRWESPECKGVFTRWRDPAHGLLFEIQFHTTESWALVSQTHGAYLRITDPMTPPAERTRLRERQVADAAGVPTPPDCMDITDFRAAAR